MANCIRNGSHYRRHRYLPGEINCAGCGEARPLVDVAKERLARLEDRGEFGHLVPDNRPTDGQGSFSDERTV